MQYTVCSRFLLLLDDNPSPSPTLSTTLAHTLSIAALMTPSPSLFTRASPKCLGRRVLVSIVATKCFCLFCQVVDDGRLANLQPSKAVCVSEGQPLFCCRLFASLRFERTPTFCGPTTRILRGPLPSSASAVAAVAIAYLLCAAVVYCQVCVSLSLQSHSKRGKPVIGTSPFHFPSLYVCVCNTVVCLAQDPSMLCVCVCTCEPGCWQVECQNLQFKVDSQSLTNN